jgi:hypothetical protein
MFITDKCLGQTAVMSAVTMVSVGISVAPGQADQHNVDYPDSSSHRAGVGRNDISEFLVCLRELIELGGLAIKCAR